MRSIKVSGIILLLIVSGTTINSQDTNDVFYKSIVLSVKAGYQTKDNKYNSLPSWSSEDLPASFTFDIGFDIPLGKNLFLGLKYNGWFSKDEFYDGYNSETINRNIYGRNVDLIFKYRFRSNKLMFSPGIGIGFSTITTSYTGFGVLNSDKGDGMPNFTAQANIEYFLTKNVILGVEYSYYGMGQFDVGGGGRSNSFMQFKSGISYIFRLK